MTLNLSKTEIVNDNNEVVISCLTIEEKTQALQSLGKEWSSSLQTEKDIYLQRGRILREIVNNKLYKLKFNQETKTFEEIENREFEDFLREDSKVFFRRQKPLAITTVNNYQAFYLLCNKMLSHASNNLPVEINQIRPMTHLILNDLDKAEQVWKSAVACKGEKEYPSPKDVQHAFLIHGPKKAVTLRVQHQKDKFYNQPRFKRKEIEEAPVNTVEEPVFNEPQISFNELEKYEGSIDPAINCKIITSSCHQAKESLIGFKNILYNFIHENDTEALQQLKNIDVGVYSINNLDLKVKELEDLLAEIKLLLSK